MMLQRFVVAAVLVAFLAGLIKQNEASEYESALTQLDNWLVNQPARAKTNSIREDVDFIKRRVHSREFRKGKYPELRDKKVLELANLFYALFGGPRARSICAYYREALPILGDLIATIERSDETANACPSKNCPLRGMLKYHLTRLKTCYRRLFLDHIDSVVRSALEEGGGNELGPLPGREIKNLFDEMKRQSWIDQLFDCDTPYNNVNAALVAKSRLRKGEDPFKTDGLLFAIAMSIYPSADFFMTFRDEQTGAYGAVNFTKAQAMDSFEKKMKKPCESYVRAARPFVDQAARVVEEGGVGNFDYRGGKMVYWYLVCEVVVEMKFTEEMADAVVRELEERHREFEE